MPQLPEAPPVPASRLVPPGWVFLIAWPVLKLGALRADAQILRRPRRPPGRGTLVALRAADWVAFFAFGRVMPRWGSLPVVLGLTVVQAGTTAEVVRRGRRDDPVIARALAPQLAWLAYATAVPLLLARRRR